MTTVNWEREPGDKVEEFVAAMLLLAHPHGNRITPSRGDRGVDIRVWNPDGYDIYQVKRYARPLTAKQAADVTASWATFVEETLPVLPVRSWTLATPWDPSNERLDWLEGLTSGAGIRTSWMGRATLDGMASQRPALVDYYFGDGGQRLQRLMADALQGARDGPSSVPAEDLLDAVVTRHRSLAATLNEIDPFYRYELDIRTGQFADQPWDADVQTTSQVAFIQYTQLDSDHYQVLRLIPRCAESTTLRPITASVQLEVSPGSPEHQAVQEFRAFGTPFQDVPGTIVEVTGPPGLSRATGPGRFTFMVADPANDMPDLEVRLLAADGSALHSLDLVDVERSRGWDGGPGFWIAGRDRGGAIDFRFFLNGPHGDELRLGSLDITGKAPVDVLPALRMAAAFAPDTSVVLAIRGGKPIGPAWDLGEASAAINAHGNVALLEALIAIQAHTYQRVVIPNVDTTSPDELARVLRVGRLLNGDEIEATWTEETLTVTGRHGSLPPANREFSLFSVKPLTVRLNGVEVLLDMQQRVLYRSVQMVTPAESDAPQAGDRIRLIPGSDQTALIAAVPADEIPPNLTPFPGGTRR